MHRIDTVGAVGNQFSNGDPGLGQPGTPVDAAWLNAAQEEIANAIEAAGITLVKGTNTQLAAALLHVLARINTWTAAQTFQGGVASTAVGPNGDGLVAAGAGTGAGVKGTASHGGPAVHGLASGTSPGVVGEGGSSGGSGGSEGVRGTGGGGTPGAFGGDGVVGVGGGKNTGLSGGCGGRFTGAADRGAITLVPHTATPTAPVDGDMWVENVGGVWHLKVRMNGATSTIV